MAVKWEKLDRERGPLGRALATMSTFRLKVPGGRLVYVAMNFGGGLTFLPDPDHRWDGNSLPGDTPLGR